MKQDKLLKHFILWSKNWYELSTKIDPITNYDRYLFETLKRVLYLDGYEYITTKADIINILINFVDEYNEWALKNNSRQLQASKLGRNMFDMAYYSISDTNPSYFFVFVMALRNFFAYCIDMSKITLPKPHYDKKLYKFGLSKYGCGIKNGITYKEMNKQVNEFWEKILNK